MTCYSSLGLSALNAGKVDIPYDGGMLTVCSTGDESGLDHNLAPITIQWPAPAFPWLTNMSEVSFSYSIGSPSSQSSTTEQLWSFNSVEVFPCSVGTVTLLDTRSNKGLLAQAEVAEALSHCSPFRSIDSHLEHILAAIPPLRDTPDDARNILNGIKEAGFLESSSAAWQRITHDAIVEKPTPAKLFILTCDRTEALERLLSNLSTLELDPEVVGVWIIDDSKQSSSVALNANIIASYQERLPVPIAHIDPIAQQTLIDHIDESVPECKSSTAFLLDAKEWPNSPTYGRARNLGLALSAGYRAVILDDDILLHAVAPPVQQRALRLDSPGDREAKFYETHEDLTRHALRMGSDPLTLVLQDLGQTLGSLVTRQLTSPQDLAGWDGALLSRYHSNSPVTLTQCGTWGDPGTNDGNWLFFLPSQNIKTLLSSDTDLKELLAANSCWYGYRGPTLTGYGVMSAVTGLDHQNILPPYFPAGRGEDLLFGIMLQRVYPHSVVYNEGWSIQHEPVDTRTNRTNLTPLSVNPGLSTLADWLGHEPRDQWGLSPEHRLRVMSEEILTLSEMHADSLEILIGTQLASKQSTLLRRCTAHLEILAAVDETPNKTMWANFLSETQQALVNAIQNEEPTPVARALQKSSNIDIAGVRSIGESFGKAIADWPKICQAAKAFPHTD